VSRTGDTHELSLSLKEISISSLLCEPEGEKEERTSISPVFCAFVDNSAGIVSLDGALPFQVPGCSVISGGWVKWFVT